MASLIKIEGIGAAFTEKLAKAGVRTTEALLKQGGTPKGRKEMAEKSGMSEKMILRFINMADLFRIKGVGEEYSDLLEAAGVDTVPELAQRNAANLHKKMLEVNAKKNLVRRPPTEAEVGDWISQAKELPRMVQY